MCKRCDYSDHLISALLDRYGDVNVGSYTLELKLMEMMFAQPSDLVLLPQCQLRLFLLQFLRTFHHKVDDVDAASQKQQHQDVS